METITPKSKIEIIKETREFYENNPRAMDVKDNCVYENSEGLQCAHSRCLVDSFNRKEISTNTSAATLIDLHNDDIHKPEYRGHDRKFWFRIQSFHDVKLYWQVKEKGNELTRGGENYYQFLIKEYSGESRN